MTVVVDEEIVNVVTISDGAVSVVSAGSQGPPGAQGVQGVQGIEGPQGDMAHYRHVQSIPSVSWLIEHGLGCFPAVNTVDSAGTKCVGDIVYLDDNRLIVSFEFPFSGTTDCT